MARLVGTSSKKDENVAKLEKRLTTNPSDLNPLVDLIATLRQSKDAQVKHAAIYSLFRVFVDLIQRDKLRGHLDKQHTTPEARTVQEWTKARYDEYLHLLGQTLQSPDEHLRLSALKVLLELSRVESERLIALSSGYRFAEQTWRIIVPSLLSASAADVQTAFLADYINHYDDVRYYFLKEAAVHVSQDNAVRLLVLLEGLHSMPSEPSHLNRFMTTTTEALQSLAAKGVKKPKKRKRSTKDVGTPENDGSTGIFDSSSDEETPVSTAAIKPKKLPDLLLIKSHKRVFQDCWLAALPFLSLEEEYVKRVLSILHRSILPHLVQPETFLDFLSDACDRGGTAALLALNGLYTLILKHNLDYPSFYRRLYNLLDRNMLQVKYRARFFRMLDTFLASPRLPVILVASFVKRLSRLSLAASPAAIITVIPFVYNMIKRHPQCIQMIHNDATDFDKDPFKADEPDPTKTVAIDSSLWELTSFSTHYLASVSTLAKIFAQQLSKPSYQLEDFLDHTYTSLFETEMNRKLLKPPALDLPPTAAKHAAFFPESKPREDVVWSDAVTELWTF